jgi:hypothetical protein
MKLSVLVTLAMIVLLGLYVPPALTRLLTDIIAGMGF